MAPEITSYQNAMACFRVVGVCAGLTSGLAGAEPINPVIAADGLLGKTVGQSIA